VLYNFGVVFLGAWFFSVLGLGVELARRLDSPWRDLITGRSDGFCISGRGVRFSGFGPE
jgi:hypothetical protein